MNTLRKLGHRIKLLREKRGWTQEGFEEITGLNARYISALERGTKNATVEVLEKVALGLKVDLFILFSFDSSDDRPSRQALKKIIEQMSEDQVPKAAKIIFTMLE